MPAPAFVGSVGTGFTAALATSVRKALDAITREGPAVALRQKGIVWTEPTLIAEVAFRGWTGDGLLRHSSFKGIRDRADAAKVYHRTG